MEEDIFNRLCSIYTDAHDNYGRYVDRETGELIQQMTIREFCLTDRWRPIVERLRALIAAHGPKKAKAMPEYKATKELLPGATLSGLFELREVEEEKRGRFWCSRRTSHLMQHTGFICIDIDLQDNQTLEDMSVTLDILRYRPEVALLMKSCSGTGYFALIPIAYPQYHKEQFLALQRDYAAMGIVIDRQCSDVVRVRFASYDEHPFVNPHPLPYSGIYLDNQQMLAPKASVLHYAPTSSDELVKRVERMIAKLEALRIDITGDYADWMRVGFALANLPDPYGRQFFHRVSALYSKYNAAETDRKFSTLKNPKNIGIATFFGICKSYGVTL